MVRPAQLIHPQRPLVPTRPAATLLLLRDSGARGGLEVLMTRRAASARFAPNAFVFPGGCVDAADASAQAHALATRRPGQSVACLTETIAALRETFEELGILLACHADGAPATAADVARLDRRAPLVAQLAAHGLQLAAADAPPLARWIGARDLQCRFDTLFLLARMPAGQTPRADETEQFEPLWLRPQDALERHANGALDMIYPTVKTLQWLQQHADVASALGALHGVADDAVDADAPLWISCPRAGLRQGALARFMESEPPFGELELVCPDGQPLHPLDWQSHAPVPLLRNLQRLTAPNPGVMTGPGTNSYLVGDAQTGYIVIDPGPDDAAHAQRLWAAARRADGAGGHIRAIVCTHSHPDHAPGARTLQALCASSGAGSAPPPILGLPSAPTARAASAFTPDRALQDGETLVLAPPITSNNNGHDASSAATHTLRVIHTPGHAANHLCLILCEDGLLFSGDHILGGSSTIVDPPDGNMTQYLDSLDRLARLCAGENLRFILPAHGHAMNQPLQKIARLKAHRLAREARILAAAQACPQGALDDWLALAYADLPRAAWPLARRSLIAHVQRLQALGLIAAPPAPSAPQ
ncbi:MAG: MBL fold metallo-hydrolase [Burkholderiaceae bacterium]|nr:MBL fold metallo-hydrolase [Burkholderiaceae bacterium]